VDVLVVDAYSDVKVCTPLFFWVRLVKKFLGSKSFLNFFQNSNGHIP
jgi:hypothetical protein